MGHCCGGGVTRKLLLRVRCYYLVVPSSLRFSRRASFFALLAAAFVGFAFALFSCLIFFFSESVSLSGIIYMYHFKSDAATAFDRVSPCVLDSNVIVRVRTKKVVLTKC